MNYLWIGLLVLLVIILIIVAVCIYQSGGKKTGGGSGDSGEILNLITGRGRQHAGPVKQIILIDGLNYIIKHMKLDREDSDQDPILVQYPDIVNISRYIERMRKEYPTEDLVVVLKNQDGYYLSKHDHELYNQLALRLKCSILVAYDPAPGGTEHITRGRDDALLIKTSDELKKQGYSVQVVSDDKFRDRDQHSEVPPYRVLKYPY